MMLSVQGRSTTWSIQYGLGAVPTSFTSVGTWTDPGTFGTTAFSLSDSAALAAMSDQGNVWIRIVALTASTGSASRDSVAIDNFSLSFASSLSSVDIGNGLTFTSSDFGGNAYATPASTMAVFNGAAGTVNLSGNVSVAALKFVTNGYTLAGGASDSIAVNGVIEVADATTSTISGKITGATGLTKSGTGTLVLTGTNDYVGTTNISNGTLAISSDAQLGASTNGIVLGGTLATAGSITLNAGRAISGSGGLDVTSGNTLTVAGAVSADALTLTNSGTVVFNNAVKSASSLTLAKTSDVTFSNGALTLSTGLISNQTGGTSTITGGIIMTAGSKDIIVNAGTLALNGSLTHNTSGYITKKGAGTLDLTNTTTTLQGITIGTAQAIDGGTLRIDSTSDLGVTQMRMNYGMIEAIADIVTANTISLGSRVGTVSGFKGTGAVTTGALSFFTAGTEDFALKVDNVTTIAGLGSSGDFNFRVGGSGKLILSATSSAFTQTLTTTDSVKLFVNSDFGGNIIVGQGTSLGGIGAITGTVVINSGGSLAPGNSIGTLSTGALTVERGGSLFFELGASGVSDKIVSSGNFGTAGDGTILLDFGGTGVSGGIYTLLSFVGLDLSLTAGDTSAFSISGLASGLVGTLDLTSTDLKLIIAGSAIPEPSTYAAILGAASLAYIAIRRRKGARSA